MIRYIVPLLLTLLAPLLGGLIYGLERVVRARMQNRRGPHLLQPFYDVLKLQDKRALIVHSAHAFLGIMHFVAMWFALATLLLGGDFLLVIFLHLLSTALLVIAGYSVRSPFSHLGASRLALSALAYEPVLVVVAVCFFLTTGSFDASASFGSAVPIVAKAPLAFLAFVAVMPIKLKKSPFDVAEAHQEIVGGAEIEYSGPFFRYLHFAKWLEYVFAYALVYSFAGANVVLGLALVAITFLFINALDNSTARVSFRQMLGMSLGVALPVALINLVYIVLRLNPPA